MKRLLTLAVCALASVAISRPALAQYEDEGPVEDPAEERPGEIDPYEPYEPPSRGRSSEPPQHPYPRPPGAERGTPREGTSVSVDVGGGLVSLGGLAFPKIALEGDPNEDFRLIGLGGLFGAHVDFDTMGLDWRLGVSGVTPGYLGFSATVGGRTNLSPWANFGVFARGGAGVELMLAAHLSGTSFLVPIIKVDGEIAVEVPVAPEVFNLGAFAGVALRYGLPLGIGFDLNSGLRASLSF